MVMVMVMAMVMVMVRCSRREARTQTQANIARARPQTEKWFQLKMRTVATATIQWTEMVRTIRMVRKALIEMVGMEETD